MSSMTRTKTVVLGFRMAGTLMTPAKFDAVTRYDERFRYELIHGVLVVSPVPLPQATGPNEKFGQLLLNYRDQHPQGLSLDYTLPEQYVFISDSRRRPDRLIWAGLGRAPDREKDRPTIAVEFVSKAKRDRQRDYIEKRAEYRAIGIPEYLVFDRFRRTLSVFPVDGSERILKEDEVYRTPFLPGFELRPATLFAVAEFLK